MTAPTVEVTIHELMDPVWNVAYDLLEVRGLPGDGLDVGECPGIQTAPAKKWSPRRSARGVRPVA